jgi:hypothetical protein
MTHPNETLLGVHHARQPVRFIVGDMPNNAPHGINWLTRLRKACLAAGFRCWHLLQLRARVKVCVVAQVLLADN